MKYALCTAIMAALGAACGADVDDEPIDTGEAEEAVCQTTSPLPGFDGPPVNPYPTIPTSCLEGSSECISIIGNWLADNIAYHCTWVNGAPNCNPECATWKANLHSLMDSYCHLPVGQGSGECPETCDDLYACKAGCADKTHGGLAWTICTNACSRTYGPGCPW